MKIYAWLCGMTLLLVGISTTPAQEAPDTCDECHQDAGLRLTHPRLYDYYREWQGSKHASAGVACHDCHGGDPKATEARAAHGVHMRPTDPESPVFHNNVPATCGRCHQAVYRHFVTSAHSQRLDDGTRLAPNCGTCHGTMRASVDQQFLAPTCNTCHDGTKLPDVTPQARRVLQHLKIARAYLGWTSLYYEEKGQPEKMRPVREQYQRVADGWHRFQLDQTEQESAKLLSQLEALLKEAWAQRKQATPTPAD